METRIVIIGGGFGGLRAALDLDRGLRARQRKDVEILLVDRNPHHTYTPLLYKLAAGGGHAASLAYPFADLLAGSAVRHIEDAVREFDLLKGVVHLTRGAEIRAQYLLLAPGSETNYFGIPGLETHALALKTVDGARTIAARLKDLGSGKKVVIGGGGPAGIELAAEIKMRRPELGVSIIEAMPTLLPGFDAGVARLASARLSKLGIAMLADAPITEARDASILTKSGAEIPFDLCVWTGGVKPPEVLKTLPLERDQRGRLEVSPSMECTSTLPGLGSKLYALGDAAATRDHAGKPVPGMARTAITQGSVAARNILADLDASGQGKHASYRHITYPYVIPIAGRWGLSKIGPFILRGLPAWLFKEAITLNYLLSIMPPQKAFATWRYD